MGPMVSVSIRLTMELELISEKDMDFLSLPFEIGAIEGGSQNVTEQDVPLQSFGAEWFR